MSISRKQRRFTDKRTGIEYTIRTNPLNTKIIMVEAKGGFLSFWDGVRGWTGGTGSAADAHDFEHWVKSTVKRMGEAHGKKIH